MTDDERERQIVLAAEAMENARTLAEKRAHWERMRELILGRSPAQVAKLEIAKGLRAA